MLTKLENVYLGVLRVVILVAASLALLLTAWGLISSVPQLLRWSGVMETNRPSGGSLRQFIAEHRITGTSSSTSGSASDGADGAYVDPNVREAARKVVSYLGRRGSLEAPVLERGLQQDADRLLKDALAYGRSVNDLATELVASKGKPLSELSVMELLQWHRERFVADVAARHAREAEANARFWVQMAFAGAAFVAFVLIVFVFLFVKIERSLRAMRYGHAGGEDRSVEHAA